MATMTALSTVTVGAGGAANIEFTNIPQTYTDLVVKISGRSSTGDTAHYLRFNSSTSNLNSRYLYGTGSAIGSVTEPSVIYFYVNPSTFTASTFANTEIYIPNYTSSNNKSVSIDAVTENNATLAYAALFAGLWSNTAAITSIQLVAVSGFVQYSTATLYGVFKGPETLPSTPTIGTATDAGTGTSVSVTFTPTSATGVDASYTALSSPGSITATGSSSPITVSGLTTGTAYTFQVRANNPGGSSAYSSASNSVTPTVPNAYESIASTTVGAGGASLVDFTSIPQTYKHLQLRVLARSTDTATSIEFDGRFNNDQSGSYSDQTIYASGGGSISTFNASGTSYMAFQRISGANTTAGNFGAVIIDVLDYTSTSKGKTVRQIGGQVNNDTSSVAGYTSNYWNNTSAITSFVLYPNTGNFAQHTVIALYGIKDS